MNKNEEAEEIKEEYYNVALIKLHEDIDIQLSDKIIDKINRANKDQKIKAIIIDINCGGGEISASFEIASALDQLDKFTTAYIRGIGTSGAYLIASATDSIFTNSTSTIGSLSVDWSFFDETEKNEKSGIKYNILTSGKYKKIRSSYKPLTKDEKQILMRVINLSHETFIDTIVKNRQLEHNEVSKYATGEIFEGSEAYDLGLVDSIINNKNELEKIISQKMGEDAVVKIF